MKTANWLLGVGVAACLVSVTSGVFMIATGHWWGVAFLIVNPPILAANYRSWRKSWALRKNATRNSTSQPQPPSISLLAPPSPPSPLLSDPWSLNAIQRPLPSASPSSSLSRPDRPFVGFRAWNYYQGRLQSVSMTNAGPWKLRQINVAKCAHFDGHHPAEPNCQCGFWALWDLDAAQHYGETVGAILGWGRVQRHGDQGFRAQYAQIIGICFRVPNMVMSTGLTVNLGQLRGQQQTLKELAEKADVPLLGASELKKFGLSQGVGYKESKGLLK